MKDNREEKLAAEQKEQEDALKNTSVDAENTAADDDDDADLFACIKD